jgi:hypothetical protein
VSGGFWQMRSLGWGLAGVSPIGVVGWLAPQNLPNLLSRGSYGTLEGLQIGVLAGFLQWLVFKRSLPNFSACWLVWNGLAWTVGLPVGWLLGGILRQKSNLFVGEAIGLLATWLVVGGIAGVALIPFLKSHNFLEFSNFPGRGASRSAPTKTPLLSLACY